MQENADSGGFGVVALRKPHSLTAMNDVCSEYWDHLNGSRAKLARVLASAVCLCWSETNEKRPPVYDLSAGEIVAYGGHCLEWLLKHDVDRPGLYVLGHALCDEMWRLLPKEKEVVETADSFPESAASGSGGTENREAVGT